MIDHIVLDVEIQRDVDSLPGRWRDTHLMGVSVAVVYEFLGERFRVYDSTRVAELRERICAADRVTTFNGEAFDFPVIRSVPGRAPLGAIESISDDLCARIKRQLAVTANLGFVKAGWTLDNVAQATLGSHKLGEGADAPGMYQTGRWGDLTTYCIHDVCLTRDLVRFADRYGYVLSSAAPGCRLYLPPWTSALNPSPWGIAPVAEWDWRGPISPNSPQERKADQS